MEHERKQKRAKESVNVIFAYNEDGANAAELVKQSFKGFVKKRLARRAWMSERPNGEQ